MSLLVPAALLLGALAIPIILLYMLRLRRREVPVSSTLLWERLVRDREANAPWQRLRRNLLLFLQLLILAALVLALARPFREVPVVSTGSVVVLLDASASMNATDTDGDNRFEQARALAADMIDHLGEDSAMTLIEVSAAPRVLVAGAGDKAVLHDALDTAAPSMAEANWPAAVTLALAGAQGQNVSTVVISDGGLPDDLPALPGEVRYMPVGQQNANLAITALSARPLPRSGPVLFAQVTNFGAEAMDVIFSLEVDGEVHDAAPYTVLAGDAVDINLDDLPASTSQIRAALTRPAASAQNDYLSVDDIAWTVYRPPNTGRVLLVSEGNLYIEQLLLALPGMEAFRVAPDQPFPETPFDLYIFDRTLPNVLPPEDVLIIGPTRSTPLFEFVGTSTAADILRTAQTDPRMAFVTLNNVHIADFAVLDNAGWATPLAEAEGGPLILAGETDGRQVAILTFDLHRSDLPLQLAWPVLMANLLEWFSPSRALDAPDVLRPAQTVAIRPSLTADRVEITRPDGATRTYPGALTFGETDLPGIYTVRVFAGDDILQEEAFAINLFSPKESSIAPRETVTIGATTLAQAEREAMGQQEFWPFVALVGLALLALEWYIYHRGARLPDRLTSPIRRTRR